MSEDQNSDRWVRPIDMPLLVAGFFAVALLIVFLFSAALNRASDCEYQAYRQIRHHLLADKNVTGMEVIRPTRTSEDYIRAAERRCSRAIGFGESLLILLKNITHFLLRYSELGTALFTAVLTLATLFLWRSTNKLWQSAEGQSADLQRQIKAIEVMAGSMKKSAEMHERAQLVHERPYVFCADVSVIPASRVISISFANYGRTPAVVTLIRVNYIVDWQRPSPPYSRAGGMTYTNFSVLLTGTNADYREFEIPKKFDLVDVGNDAGDLKPLLADGKYAYLVVTIEYDDVQGNPHEAGTIWRYDRVGNYFVRYPTAEGHYQT